MARQARPPPKGLMRDEIHSVLRDWIIRGLLRPGERVRDVDIAGRLGVSRTPVREALRRLEHEGLIETAGNRWTRVSLVDVDAVQQIYPVVRVLEGLALVGTRLPIGEGTLLQLQDANAQLRTAIGDHQAEAASDANEIFHTTLALGSGNPELIRLIGGLHAKLRRAEIAYFGRSTAVDASLAEHQAVIDALHRQDVETARDVIGAHWQASLARAEDLAALGPAQR